MSKIRMNTELRNKILNRYRESAEQENTQELEAMKQAREQVDMIYPSTFELARQVVERSYPSEDVATCRTLKQKYGDPLDVVAKDKCFYFSYANENYDPEDESQKQISDQMFESANAINKVSRTGSLYGKLFAIKDMQLYLLKEENKIKANIKTFEESKGESNE